MALAVGIVGLPNVGKSTLFNALAGNKAQAENYPFCTIDPNVGVVPVPDPRLDALVELYHPRSVVPATLEFVDIAGLVRGASKGEGLGNQFLAHIREVDAICHVVRCFEDDNVVHVHGQVDPVADMEVIDTELLLRDLEQVRARHERAKKQSKGGDPAERKMVELTAAVMDRLEGGTPVRAMDLDEEARTLLAPLRLLTAKPVLYVANVGEGDVARAEDLPQVAAVRARAEAEGADVVPISAAIEAELSALEAEERAEYLAELGLSEPGLYRLAAAAYRLLDLITFFTAGEKEVRAWTIRKGTKAPRAAGKIHSDFERGFIRAETIAWDLLVSLGGEQAARAQGKLRSEGKDYVVADGDVIHFRFNV